MLEKLDLLMEERGLNKHSLAEQSGIPYTTVVGIYSKNYNKIKLPTLRSLSEFFGVSMEYLGNDALTDPYGSSDIQPEPISTPQTLYKTVPLDDMRILRFWRRLDEQRRLKLEGYAEVLMSEMGKQAPKIRPIRAFVSPAAACFVSPVEDRDYTMTILPPEAPEQADFSVCIRDDSMEPYIKEGSAVYVSENRDLADGEVGLFCVDGETYCRQYRADRQNLYLRPLNPAHRGLELVIPKDGGRTVYCFGKVLLDAAPPIKED